MASTLVVPVAESAKPTYRAGLRFALGSDEKWSPRSEAQGSLSRLLAIAYDSMQTGAWEQAERVDDLQTASRP